MIDIPPLDPTSLQKIVEIDDLHEAPASEVLPDFDEQLDQRTHLSEIRFFFQVRFDLNVMHFYKSHGLVFLFQVIEWDNL